MNEVPLSEVARGDTFLASNLPYMRIGGGIIDPLIPAGNLAIASLNDGQVTMLPEGQLVQPMPKKTEFKISSE